MSMKQIETGGIIRLPLRWVVFFMIGLFVVGIAGGMLGQYITQPPLPPLEDNNNRVMTTVQEVTISPNKAVATLVNRANRSTLLLGQIKNDSRNYLATGLVLTNDGLLATTTILPENNLFAFDNAGRALAINRIGEDALYGITYYNLLDNVILPLDLRQEEITPGEKLTVISRNANTPTPQVEELTLNSFDLPTPDEPIGWQRIMRGNPLSSTLLNGAPALDDEGKVAGVITDAKQGRVLPIAELQVSMDRLMHDKRESDPFEILGINIIYEWQASGRGEEIFTPQLTTVRPGSIAEVAGLKRDDIILKVNENEIRWTDSLVNLLGQDLPLNLTIKRGVEQREATLRPLSSPTPVSAPN